MKTFFLSVALGAGFLLSAGAYADAPPAGAIAQCKDGTYFTGTSHNGACKGHQGVKEWLDKDKTAAPATPPKATPKASTSTSSTSSKTAPADTTSNTAKSKKTDTTASAGTATSDTSSSKKAKSTKTTKKTADAANATPIAKCKDGTTFNGTSHKGACRGHKGVAEWLDKSSTAATPAPKAAPAATAPAPAATNAPARTPPTPAAQITQKAGGGPGLVWVNAESKVYHCQSDEWYGKTKEGSYMSEAAAKAAGNRAARGKECAQ